MEKIKLQERNDHCNYVIEIGDIRLTAYLNDGKTVIIANAIANKDYILVQPDSANQIIIKAGQTIR